MGAPRVLESCDHEVDQETRTGHVDDFPSSLGAGDVVQYIKVRPGHIDGFRPLQNEDMDFSQITEDLLIGTTPGLEDLKLLRGLGVRLVINMRFWRGPGPARAIHRCGICG